MRKLIGALLVVLALTALAGMASASTHDPWGPTLQGSSHDPW